MSIPSGTTPDIPPPIANRTPEAAGLLALGADVAEFGARYRAYRTADVTFGAGGTTPAKAALALALERLCEAGDFGNLRDVWSLYRKLDAARSASEDAGRQRDLDRYAEQRRQYDLASMVECPFCGSEPGAGCRTSGRASKGTAVHADRYRAAEHLLETRRAESGQS